ncbi:hypothetical protein EON79_08315 [bacterium]|nr:MAG: hypothetical protein EON79_08315 [bacterium]
MEREICHSARGALHPRRCLPRPDGAVREDAPRGQGRLHPLLGRRRGLLGRRNRRQPRYRPPAPSSRNPLRDGSPGELPRRGFLRSLAQRAPLQRTHLGRLQQRLRAGQRVRARLAVLVRDLPGFGSRRLNVRSGPAFIDGKASAEGTALRNAGYVVTLDPATGAIASLRSERLERETASAPLNQFLYLPGEDIKDLQKNRDVRIEVIEPGPLVATLRTTSAAPGAKSLQQEVTLVAGLDHVDLRNTIDKLPVREKEGVHFAFPFAVPNGQVRIDAPWALVRPEMDQIAGANKNWFTTQGYVDVSNGQFGVTCASLDAPLIEVGAITANLVGSRWNPDEWRQEIEPTQTFYSWALNNHWHTNYRADQQGLLVFRYRLQVHAGFRSDAASRLAIGAQQPLLVTGDAFAPEGLVDVSDPSILVTRLVPSDDGKAIIVRLWGATPVTKRVRLRWRSDLGTVTRTDLSQRPGVKSGETVEVPGWGVVTLRVERTPL